ncbi:PREDICTED: uncharacterized protein LOC108610615 [Drosophila arizonae]|uniref:Transcription initiation factor TFIID subunit 12 n=1 Tax=Drosophila arizonae TaxID=7263 RepID=A0ABM1NTL3_DROAR|nr:PREDICTED: uncharacterized protein LOC108610615 [Drosophila arizonae]
MASNGKVTAWPWIDELPGDNSDISSAEESQSSTCSLSSSSKSNHVESDKEYTCSSTNKYHIIRKSNLSRFVQKIDKSATLDDQAADLVSKCAYAFVRDVSMRLVKLAKYRNAEPSLLDLKFTLKREYNMEFPKNKNSNSAES